MGAIADAMGDAEEWNHGAMREGHGLRQLIQSFFDPFAILQCESLTLMTRRAFWKHHHDARGTVIEAQDDASRAPVLLEHQRHRALLEIHQMKIGGFRHAAPRRQACGARRFSNFSPVFQGFRHDHPRQTTRSRRSA
jgi:hypothetical protein